MRLRLDLCEIEFQLKISDWVPYNDNHSWCRVDLSVESDNVHYVLHNNEILLNYEVSDMLYALKRLLCGEQEKDFERLWFAEPDIELLMFKPGSEAARIRGISLFDDIYAEFIINFWHHGELGWNHLSLGMARNDLTALYHYLRYVVHETDDTDPAIQKMLEFRMLLPE